MASATTGKIRSKQTVSVSPRPQPVLAEWEDLERAGYPKSAFYEKFGEIYSSSVDSVYMNEGTCLDHNHYCYVVRGRCSYGNRQWSTVLATGDSRDLVNNSSKPVMLNVQLKSTQTSRVSATVTTACDFSPRKGITLNSSEIGVEGTPPTLLQLENYVGHNSSKSEDVVIVRSVDVALQPGQTARAVLDVSWTELKQEFEIPFAIDGWCMSTLRRSVNGQRSWLHDIASLFETPRSCMRGTFECVYDIRGWASVSYM